MPPSSVAYNKPVEMLYSRQKICQLHYKKQEQLSAGPSLILLFPQILASISYRLNPYTAKWLWSRRLTHPGFCSIISIFSLLYSTWRVTKNITDKTQAFVNRCLRYILGIRWPNTISNEDLWLKTQEDRMMIQVRKKEVEMDRPHAKKTTQQRN